MCIRDRNKIFDRTESLYGKDQVALLHGDAGLELFTRSRQKNAEETEGERRKAMDLARHLTKPYVVATADQIAPSALRYPGYERILSTLMDGALIIDEVQAVSYTHLDVYKRQHRRAESSNHRGIE